MKATGEVMAIGRNIEESLLKACRSLEIGVHHNEMPELAEVSDDSLIERLSRPKMIVSSMCQKQFAVVTHQKKSLSLQKLISFTLINSCISLKSSRS